MTRPISSSIIEALKSSGATFGVLFGLAGTIFAATTVYLNRDRELDLEMVRLSIAILSAPYSNSEADPIQRRFAVESLRKFSGVELSDEEVAAWAKAGGSFPKATTVAEVCGSIADSFALSFGTKDPRDKADADRDYHILSLLKCIPESALPISAPGSAPLSAP